MDGLERVMSVLIYLIGQWHRLAIIPFFCLLASISQATWTGWKTFAFIPCSLQARFLPGIAFICCLSGTGLTPLALRFSKQMSAFGELHFDHVELHFDHAELHLDRVRLYDFASGYPTNIDLNQAPESNHAPPAAPLLIAAPEEGGETAFPSSQTWLHPEMGEPKQACVTSAVFCACVFACACACWPARPC